MEAMHRSTARGAGGKARILRIAMAGGAVLLGLASAASAVDTDKDGIEDPVDNCVNVANASQTDSDGDQFGNACDGDLDGDGIVNFSDLARMRIVFFQRDPDADLNGDGVVNFADLAMLRALFFKPPGPSGLLPAALPVFDVVKEGLSEEEAKNLAAAFGVEAPLGEDGSLQFVSDALGDVPMVEAVPQGPVAAELPRDEDGQETTMRAFDLPAIQKIVPVSARVAETQVLSAFRQAGVPLPGQPGEAAHKIGHTMLNIRSIGGDVDIAQPIDTFVRFDFMLAGRPLIGPGAKVRIGFSPAGELTGLHHATRELKQGEMAPIVSPFDARRACVAHYPEGSKLNTPQLVYFAPALESRVQKVFPHYECRGTGPGGEALVRALLPAVQGAGPEVDIEAGVTQGSKVGASVRIKGGTPPFAYSWQSLTTDLSPEESSEPSVSYDVMPREPVAREMLGVTVTDANGLVGKARVTLEVGPQLVLAAAGAPPDLQRLGRLDVGGEFNVYEWNCVKQSAAGFSAVFGSKGVPVQFKWTGTGAWERDFRESSAPQNGNDSAYVDDVDLAWYTGHGSPGSFTFDNPNRDDGSIVPGDARWGNRDLEWMNLESCNVLQFESGGTLIWDRWAKVFDGLHLLNGFQTTASCVDVANGTAGRFSQYLFPRQILFITLPALKVRQAWAQMAHDLEPSGRQYVTMGAASAGWVTNYDDYFWGQGPVGPDIPKSQIIGYWWLAGEV